MRKFIKRYGDFQYFVFGVLAFSLCYLSVFELGNEPILYSLVIMSVIMFVMAEVFVNSVWEEKDEVR